ncbi:MAG TPA: PQQ-binding-like beta-propeller repeat protein [Acidimicrobiales bacterium]
MLALGLVTGLSVLVGAATGASAAATDWPVYHHDLAGSGVDASGTSFAPAVPSWTSASLDGQLYGEPLVSGGLVYAATENDTVYALSAATGAVVWATHVGTPVASSSLPCGDIAPSVGITSTPVIDQARGEIFVVADELVNGAPAHQLVGLDLATGAVELQQDVDPPGAYTPALLQRVALTLDAGRVIFGYGGNFGDCSTFNGWVVGVPETGGPMATFEVDQAYPGQQGAVWMGGGAPVVDAQGNIWVSVGNSNVTSPTDAYDDSESVLELSSSLALEQFFATPDWYADNANDRDLGSSSPVLLGNGEILQAGKSQTEYLLSQAHLGGIGGQQASLPNFCGGNVDGGSAVVGSVAYVPCQSGVIAVQTSASPPGLSIQWKSSSGAGGPPIVASGLVWTISSSGTLFGLDPTTGAAVQQFALGAESNHFPTPAVGDGLLLAPSSTSIHAFTGAPPVVGMAAGADGGGYWLVAADGGVFSYGDAGFHGSMGGQHLNAPVVGIAASADGGGYWLVGADGGVFAFGDAAFYGSMGGRPLNRPIVGIVGTPDGHGYWEVAADGGVFAFGDAAFYGSMGGQHLNASVVGIAADRATGGYWEVAADGGIFAFDAAFYGSAGSLRLNQPVVAMAAMPDGAGYRLAGADGGIFAYGDAPFAGSMGGRPLAAPVTGLATGPGGGYWEVARDGGIFAFGGAQFFGSRA